MSHIARYSSLTTDVHYKNDIFGDVQVNFSGVPGIDGSRSRFTIGGWVRIKAPQPSGSDLFTVITEGPKPVPAFQIRIDTNGQVVAGFGTQVQVRSHSNLADGAWHYVGLSFYGALPGESVPDAMRLFADGCLLDQASGVAPTPAAALHGKVLLLGQSFVDSAIEFASWVIWSEAVVDDFMDVPKWGSPLTDTTGVARALNFSDGLIEAMTATGTWQALPPPPSQWIFNWNTRCAQIVTGVALQVPTTEPLLPVNAPFTVMGWLGVKSAENGSAVLLSDMSCTAALRYDVARKVVIPVLQVQGSPAHEGAAVPASDWHLVALTYDGTFRLYIDGAEVLSTASASPSGPLYVGGNNGLDFVTMQNLSFWSGVLSPSDISARMDAFNPVGQADCLAWYPLTDDFGDSKSGNLLLVNVDWMHGKAGTIISEMQTAVSATKAATILPAERLAQRAARIAEGLGDTLILRYQDYVVLARQHGIDPDATPSGPVTRDVNYVQSLAWYDQFLQSSKVDPNLATRFRGQFARNLYVGMKLAEAAPRLGRFEFVESNGANTLVYHGAKGAIQIADARAIFGEAFLEANADDNRFRLYMNLFIDGIAIVLGALGVISSATKIQAVATALGPRITAIGNWITAAIQGEEGASEAAQGLTGLLTLLQGLVRVKIVSYLIYNVIIESWWNFIFTVFAAVGQILGFILSGGWLLAAKIAMMVIAVVNFVRDIIALIQAPPALAAPAAAPAG